MDERRRQRRQQRILASGQSRLGKITSTAFPEQTHFSTKRRDSTEDPSEELGAPPALLPQLDDPFLAMSHNNMNDNPFFANNPFFTANVNNSNNNTTISQEDVSVKYWNLVRLFLMTLLGLFIAYKERSVMGRDQFASLLHQNTIYSPYTVSVLRYMYKCVINLYVVSILVLCSCRTHFTNSSDDVS
ncbi:hypothetical protein RMCBS344292_02535 [Rhizopus microsporus]|nr:hypothetical protein RMCBS344292_02535 [Rhizopus microsporus]